MKKEELEKQVSSEEKEEVLESETHEEQEIIEEEKKVDEGKTEQGNKEEAKHKIRYELVNKHTFKRDTIYKLVTFASLAIVVMASSSIAGIMCASATNKELEHEPEETPVVVEEKKEIKLPIYSEEAKERMKTIYDNTGDEKIAYLTFDDGPSEKITPQILETLKNEDVKATFFLLGSRVELYPELVKREFEEGHYIANHGYSHVYTSVYASAQSVLDEYNKTEEKIREALQIPEYSSHLFRFPGGSEGGKYKKIKNDAKGLLEENNVAFINWNCLTNDSVGKPTYESIINDFKITQNR